MFVAPVIFEPTDRRIRIKRNGHVIADSVRAMMLIEHGHHPAYYLPKDDFVQKYLVPSQRTEQSRNLGPTRFWSLDVADEIVADAVRGHDEIPAGTPSLAGYLGVDWAAAQWFEEDEEIFRHARNPYARVDAIASSRQVEVLLGGKIVATTRRAVFLFETGLITRYYMPVEDVVSGILAPSELKTYCPYKGDAHYHDVVLNGQRHANIVWYYPEPIAACDQIKGLVSFYNEKVDRILVDGQAAAPRFPARI